MALSDAYDKLSALGDNPVVSAITPMVKGITAPTDLVKGFLGSDKADAIDEETKQRTAAAIQQFEQNYKLPQTDQTPLTQEQYKLLSTYVPQVAQFIQEKAPQMVTEAGSQDAISAQNKALQAYTGLSQTGEDAQSQAQREEGNAQAQGTQNRNTAQLLRSYQNQGLSGSGQELSAALQTGQAADAQRRQLSLDVASQNEQRRQQALGQMASLAGNIRGQNANVESANVSAINAFNQRNSMNKQNYENYVANQANQAQQNNQQNQQNTANANTDVRNRTNLANRSRADQIEATNRDAANNFATTKLNSSLGQANADRAMEQDKMARDAATFNTILQAGTTIGGAALGGPAGAKVGGAVGSAATAAPVQSAAPAASLVDPVKAPATPNDNFNDLASYYNKPSSVY